MDELKQFIEVMSLSFESMSNCGFDLFRENASTSNWVVCACTHDDEGINDICGDFTIDTTLNFNDALTILVASGYPIKVHAYYYNDLY